MERRFRVRMDELLSDAEVSPGLLRGVMPRLESFLEPFVAALQTVEQRTNARHYVSGRMSERVASITGHERPAAPMSPETAQSFVSVLRGEGQRHRTDNARLRRCGAGEVGSTPRSCADRGNIRTRIKP